MTAKVLMVQGTASSVGKSVLVAALCRIFRQDGLCVAPFKAQNMALNSYVTRSGGEIGRSQVVQAEAACVEPTVEMNPVLLKPECDTRAQVIVRGRPLASLSARDYFDHKLDLWPVVVESLEKLRQDFELVVVEGAGSPAEVNLRDQDIVNMRVALYAQAPVLLVGDIDRGGVFASLLGTLQLLLPQERDLVRGLIVNKFRGDRSLLEPGLDILVERTGVPVLGVVPYLRDLRIAEEDGVALEGRGADKPAGRVLDIAVILLPHISNFDDFDPLTAEPDVGVRYVDRPESLGYPDLIIIPGTKTTISDLLALRTAGLDVAIIARARAGTPVVGICGGYQMLGERIADPEGIESELSEIDGLGLLPVTTVFFPDKRTCRVVGQVIAEEGPFAAALGELVTGYEIHMGQSTSRAAAALRIVRRLERPVDYADGAVSADGNVAGTYLHGLFANERLRRSLLQWLARRRGRSVRFGAFESRESSYDRLADSVRPNLDLEQIYALCGVRPAHPVQPGG